MLIFNYLTISYLCNEKNLDFAVTELKLVKEVLLDHRNRNPNMFS